MMPTAKPLATKVKIKFGSKIIADISGPRQCEPGQKAKLVLNASTSARENCGSQTSNKNLGQKSRILSGNKHGISDVAECPPKKRQKIDRNMTKYCSGLLKELMNHQFGWVFNTPVDPVKFCIPDYFDIIKQPMDLGTIKEKLQKDLYIETEEFAADVKLTFSNAMLYNPPENEVHQMAKALNKVFEKKWKDLDQKLNGGRSECGREKPLSGLTKEVSNTRERSPRTPPLHSAMKPIKSKPSDEKLRSSLNTRAAEVKLDKLLENSAHKSLAKTFPKGTDVTGRPNCGAANPKPLLGAAGRKCCACGMISCHCAPASDSTNASSDISCERSSERYHHGSSADVSKVEKSISTSQTTKSDPDSNGAVSSLDDENACPSSQPTTPAAADMNSGEAWRPQFDIQLSPTKALRAAMIRQRFAGTILKAQHKTLLDHGDKADPVKMQQEMERLERSQLEERARIEAQIKEAEAASRKIQREREREAARAALQQMERTIEIEENLKIIKELEMLSGGCSVSFSFHFQGVGSKVRKGRNEVDCGSPLARLGLFIKDDIDVDEEEILNAEEGEILT